MQGQPQARVRPHHQGPSGSCEPGVGRTAGWESVMATDFNHPFVGRAVVYTGWHPGAEAEQGTVTSVNAEAGLVFVRYGLGSTSAATAADDRLDGPLWWLTKDGDLCVRDLYRRHYSSRKSKRNSDLVIGPGDKIVLRSAEGDAAFAWRLSRFRRDGQEGVECSLFRNEGSHLSSILIRQADAIADFVWPGERHYTFVDPEAVRSTNPGACFRHAGWRRCGESARGLFIFER